MVGDEVQAVEIRSGADETAEEYTPARWATVFTRWRSGAAQRRPARWATRTLLNQGNAVPAAEIRTT